MSHSGIEYLNSRDRCPEAFWPPGGPDDAERCQYAFAKRTVCGLPRYADGADGSARCIAHCGGERDADELRMQLEAMVKCGSRMWHADLSGTDLLGVSLTGAQFMYADLSEAVLVNADLSGADLVGADLTDADLKFADLTGADLTDACMEGRPDLRQANLADALLTGVQMGSECKLGHTTWTEREDGMIRQERDAAAALAASDNAQALELFISAEKVYRQIKQSYQNGGDPQTASRFFIREMECRRAQLRVGTEQHPRGHILERAFWWLMRHTCGYGEWPGRLAAIGGVLVLLFAIVHGYACGFDDTRVRGMQVGPGIDWTPGIDGVVSFLVAIYFSVVTFTGLGYGDIHPVSLAGRIAASIEAVLGVLTISLFLVTIVRKWSR